MEPRAILIITRTPPVCIDFAESAAKAPFRNVFKFKIASVALILADVRALLANPIFGHL